MTDDPSVQIADLDGEVTRRVSIYMNNQTTLAMLEYMRAFRPFEGGVEEAPREWYNSFTTNEIGQLNVSNSSPWHLMRAFREIMLARLIANEISTAKHRVLDELLGKADKEEFMKIVQYDRRPEKK